MHDPKQLEGLVQGLGGLLADVREIVRHGLQAGRFRAALVFEDERLHGFDAFPGRRQEALLVFREAFVSGALFHLLLPQAQAVAENTFIVGRYIGEGAALVEGVVLFDLVPLVFRKDGRNTGDGSGRHDGFPFQDNGSFGLQHSLQHVCAALLRMDASSLEAFAQLIQPQLFRSRAEGVMLPVPDKGFQ